MWWDETAGKLYRRRFVGALKTGIEGVDGHLGLFPGQVMEIAGPHGAGKTQMMLRIALQCVLPRSLGGGESEIENLKGVAVWIDLDGKFDAPTFFNALDRSIKEGELTDSEDVKHKCLQRLCYIRCNSSFELVSVLKVLPNVLAKKELPARVGCLLIDNILSFCWSEKATEFDTELKDVPLSFARIQQSVFAELQKILDVMHLFIVVTKNTKTQVWLDVRGGTQWDQRELIQHRLQKLYTQRMILVPVTQLPESLQRQWSLDPHGLAAKWMVSNPPICA